MEAKQTPLIDLLENVPRDTVLVVEHDQFSSSSHPVGRLCHEAAAELRRLHAESERDEALLRQALEALKAENERLRDEAERLRTDGASAVRWAPGSAYWSDVLRELFGPDARDGINVVEARWQAALERADKLAEMLLRYRNEVPLGYQPHMLAHEVDDLLRDREKSHEISGYTCTVPPSPKQRENKDE